MGCRQIEAVPGRSVVGHTIIHIVERRCGRILAGQSFRIQERRLEGVAREVPLGIRHAHVMGTGAVHKEGEPDAVEILGPLPFQRLQEAVGLDLQGHLRHIAPLAGIGRTVQIQ